MITQLEIQNFRGFSDYTIDDVGQVNLLVGTNNCGKTSVLEAVHLLKQRGNKQSLTDVLLHRGEHVLAMPEGGFQEASGDLCRLFHGFQLTPQSAFFILAQDRQKEETSASQSEHIAVCMKPAENTGPLDAAPGVSMYYQLQVEWRRGNMERKERFHVNSNGGLAKPETFFSRKEERHIDSELIYASSLSPREIVPMFDSIVLMPEEDIVLDAVRIIDPNIIRLASHGGGDSASGYISRGGILVKTKKWENRVPIGNFGEGIWLLLSIILSLVGAKNGTLLIDEIDTGLHHTVMSKMWKLICVTAKKLNVQVFATTHSSDCWKTLADNAVEDEFADMPIRIHRINKDRKQAETFTNEEMHLALNRDIEVR